MWNQGGDKKTYTYDSTGKGNYSGPRKATGSDPEYAVNNIYDMAGNISDWTIEADHTNYRVVRGGKYNDNASFSPASVRNDNSPAGSISNRGSRLALYM